MQPRWTATLVGVGVVGLVLVLVARSMSAPKVPAHAASGLGEADDGGGLLFALSDAAPAPAGPARRSELTGAIDRDETQDGGSVGTLLPDGTPAPPLPLAAPRQVRFGVALVSYAGAQQAPGATPATRSRRDALTLAERLLATAQHDFHAAVEQGDPGSADDLGQVKPGVLEPAPEYVLFTLPVGAVGGPVDTPRGYWIVKRLE